jgi:hypothetical protein
MEQIGGLSRACRLNSVKQLERDTAVGAANDLDRWYPKSNARKWSEMQNAR